MAGAIDSGVAPVVIVEISLERYHRQVFVPQRPASRRSDGIRIPNLFLVS